jgi:hypothetical protein
MTIQGLNTSVTIYRATQLADDEAGGARRSAYAQVDTGRAMIAHRSPTLEMRAQGLSTDLLYDANVQPATIDVQANDMLIPADGQHAHVRFLVTSAQHPTMAHLQSPRAHLLLHLERWDSGKMVELI